MWAIVKTWMGQMLNNYNVVLRYSPTSSPFYPPGFEPWKLNDNYNGLVGLESNKEIHKDQTSMLAQKFNWMSCDDEDDTVVVDLVSKCKKINKKKKVNKKEEALKGAFKRKGTKKRRDKVDQTLSNEVAISTNNLLEKQIYEEARLTWKLGKSPGLFADNDKDVINELAKNQEYKEEDSKLVKTKGKRGSKKNSLCQSKPECVVHAICL